MNDDELRDQLQGLIPPPAPGYWEAIDASLARIGAAPGPDRSTDPGSDGRLSPVPGPKETGGELIRLTNMTSTTPRSTIRSRPFAVSLVAAAVLVALAGYVGVQLTRPNQTATVPATPATTAPSTPTPGQSTAVPATTEPGAGTSAPSGSAGTDTQTLTPGAHCFRAEGNSLVAVRLEVGADGTVTVVERVIPGEEPPIEETGAGRLIGEGSGLMWITVVGSDHPADVRLTNIWNVVPDGLWIGPSEGAESPVPPAPCAEVDADLVGLDPPPAPVPPTNPALPAGSTTCYLNTAAVPVADAYRIVVESDGVTASLVTATPAGDGQPGPIQRGTGAFVTDNDLVFLSSAGAGPPEANGADWASVVVIRGDEIQPTIYPEWLAQTTDCSLVADVLGPVETTTTTSNP